LSTVYGTANRGKAFAGILIFGGALLGYVFVAIPRINQMLATFGVAFQIPTDTNSTWGVGIIIGFLLWLVWIWLFGFFGPGVRLHSAGGKKR
jgi:hypothetical protein